VLKVSDVINKCRALTLAMFSLRFNPNVNHNELQYLEHTMAAIKDEMENGKVAAEIEQLRAACAVKDEALKKVSCYCHNYDPDKLAYFFGNDQRDLLGMVADNALSSTGQEYLDRMKQLEEELKPDMQTCKCGRVFDFKREGAYMFNYQRTCGICLGELSDKVTAMEAVIDKCREVLNTLNYTGGLGFDRHRWVDEALQAINNLKEDT
jgi:hypothetical protein